jgi:hypothetical protein
MASCNGGGRVRAAAGISALVASATASSVVTPPRPQTLSALDTRGRWRLRQAMTLMFGSFTALNTSTRDAARHERGACEPLVGVAARCVSCFFTRGARIATLPRSATSTSELHANAIQLLLQLNCVIYFPHASASYDYHRSRSQPLLRMRLYGPPDIGCGLSGPCMVIDLTSSRVRQMPSMFADVCEALRRTRSRLGENPDVDRRFLGHTAQGASDESSGVLRPRALIHAAVSGDIVLLKGERWPGNRGRGAVHRSPLANTTRPRLVMTLDPLGN